MRTPDRFRGDPMFDQQFHFKLIGNLGVSLSKPWISTSRSFLAHPSTNNVANRSWLQDRETNHTSQSASSDSHNDPFQFDRHVHIEIIPRVEINHKGFKTISGSIAAGLSFESRHMSFELLGRHSNVRMSDEFLPPNPHSHLRTLNAEIYARSSSLWLLGMRGEWAKLSTTNYSSQLWRLYVGAGRDFVADDTSIRLTGQYSPGLFDHRNGAHNISVKFMVPSPLSQRHVMFVQEQGICFFHDTISDPQNQVLTKIENSRYHLSGSVTFGVEFRY